MGYRQKFIPTFERILLLAFVSLIVLGLNIPALAQAKAGETQDSYVESWFLPNERELKTLIVRNLSSQPRTLWISGPMEESSVPLEISYEVSAFGILSIPTSDWEGQPWVKIKTTVPQQLHLRVHTSADNEFVLWPGPSTQWRARNAPNADLSLINLAPFPQTLKLSSGSSEVFLHLNAFEKKRWSIGRDGHFFGTIVTVTGEARFAGLTISPTEGRAMTPISTPEVLNTDSNPSLHYFLFSNQDRSQSFVAALSSAKMIQEARQQIQSPGILLPRILIAEIDFSHRDENRNFSDPRKTPWSWHVSNAIGFASFASQSCDGSPEFLEDALALWKDQIGNICFWNYKVIQELTVEQVSTGALP